MRDFVREQANHSKRVNASTRCSSVMEMAFGEKTSAKRPGGNETKTSSRFHSGARRYEAPPPPPSEPLRKEDAENLLRRLVSEAEPATVNARYILALILERKRILRPIESSDESLLVYEHAGTGESIVVPNPRLSLDQLSAVQNEVYEMLAGSLR